MRVTLSDPMTGAAIETKNLAAGETLTLPARDATVVVGQLTRTARR
jgi:hypothetical protein